MMSLSEIYKWFDDQDTFGKGLLLFAFSQIVVFIIMALKEYKIFDATPYMTASLQSITVIALILLVIAVLVICGLMVMMVLNPSCMVPEKDHP